MKRRQEKSLPDKANRILNGILIALLLIVFKIWHLSVIQHDAKVEESKGPQRRTLIEKADRATICDRFGIPMAVNNVQYNASIIYGPIREIPRSVWQQNPKGKRVKCMLRKEYITSLAHLLAQELKLDTERVEDLIHSKAAILGNVPCVIKENIAEEEYFRLKLLEKDWPGIQAEHAPRRSYPLKKIGAEVVGFIGPISKNEYDAVTREMCELRQILSGWEEGIDVPFPNGYASIEEIDARLIELERRAYGINDHVGKMGVEATYDAQLRGMRGKKTFLADTRGNFLRELAGSEEPVPGEALRLTISSELQEFAEKLLLEYDQAFQSQRLDSIKKKNLIPENQPWIKGGAIIALEPKTGEVLALASFPRFDPNDFIRFGELEENREKNGRVCRWLETENYLASIWDLKRPFEKERFDKNSGSYYEEELDLGWKEYLNCILPATSPVMQILDRFGTIGDAFFIQKKVGEMLAFFASEEHRVTAAKVFDFVYHGGDDVEIGVSISLQEREFFEKRYDQVKEDLSQIKNFLSSYFSLLPLNYEKILLVDLYRLALDENTFSPKLIDLLAAQSIREFREASAHFVSVNEAVKKIVEDLFHEIDFRKWREEHFQDFLSAKRKEEKAAKKKYAKPYIEFLDAEEKKQFSEFWIAHRWDFLTFFLTGASQEDGIDLSSYFSELSTWKSELQVGAHSALPWVLHYHRFKTIISDFQEPVIMAYLKTLRSFEELNRTLLGSYPGMRNHSGSYLERDLASTFYPTYGFGYARSHAFRQAVTIGSIFKLIPAYEALRQRYQIKKSDLNPLTIVDDKHRVWGKSDTWNVGYTLDGRPIPMFYHGGRLPRSDHASLGQVDLVRALEVSSNPYFAILAGDVLEDPEDLCKAANTLGYGEKSGIDLPGEYSGKIPCDVVYNRTGLYAMAIGQHSLVGTPLQTALMLSALANGGAILKPYVVAQQGEELISEETRWRIFLPHQIQDLLLAGMRQVIMGEGGTARSLRSHYPMDFLRHVVGKTSTAEVIEHFSLDGTSGKLKSKHVCFGAIAYDPESPSKPEIVVVAYLRHGDWGWNAAPLSMEVIKKWREIKARNSEFCLK